MLILREKRAASLEKQRGAALIMIVFLAFMTSLLMITTMNLNLREAYSDSYESQESRQALLSSLRSEVETFYLAHSNELAQSNLPSSISGEKAAHSIPTPSNSPAFVKVGITDLKSDYPLQWRDIYVWIPAGDGSGADGIFRPSSDNPMGAAGEGVEYIVVSGKPFESRKMAEASSQIESIALDLRSMFTARVNADPLRTQSANYFADCGPRTNYMPNDETLSCTSSGSLEPLVNINAPSSIGLSGGDFINPWGEPIRGSNRQGNVLMNGDSHPVQSESSPFNMIISSQMPSGYQIFTYVTQPI